jgi:hypothetical protein
MVAGCVHVMSARLEINNDSAAEILAKFGLPIETALVTLASPANCTAAGTFPVPGNCSLFQVCVPFNGVFVSVVATCAPSNFDPAAQACSSTYVCTECTVPGFICVNNTTFTLCADNGVSIVSNIPCLSGYYCNEKCLNYIPDC